MGALSTFPARLQWHSHSPGPAPLGGEKINCMRKIYNTIFLYFM